MILGASYLQLPAIKKAKEMGFSVAVADIDIGAIGIKYADKFYHNSTNDSEGIYEAAKDYQADAILTLATDMPVRSVAYACEKLNLNSISYDCAVKSTDKYEMVKAFKQNNVPHPRSYKISNINKAKNIKDELTFPYICKPIDSSGSRGVVLINTVNELEESINYSMKYSEKSTVLLQEYLQGNEVSVEVLVNKGEIHIIAVTDKITTGPPHFVETGHSQPSMLKQSIIHEIENITKLAIKAIGIQTGPAHVELMVTKDGPKVIELGARLGGDFIATHLVYHSTGIDMVNKAIKLACGEDIEIPPYKLNASAIKFLSAPKGTITQIEKTIDFLDFKEIIDIKILKNIGDNYKKLTNSNDRLGYVITKSKTVTEAMVVCDRVVESIKISVE